MAVTVGSFAQLMQEVNVSWSDASSSLGFPFDGGLGCSQVVAYSDESFGTDSVL